MTSRAKILLIVFGILVAFTGGFYLGKGEKEITEIIKEGKERVVYKDRIVTVTKTVYPDGRIEEKTKTEEKEGVKEKETLSNKKEEKPILADYALGAKYWAGRGRSLESISNVEVTGGRRLFGDIWLEAGVLPVNLQGSIGLSIKF